MNSYIVNGVTLNGGVQRYVSGSASFVGVANLTVTGKRNAPSSAQFYGVATVTVIARRNYGAFDPCERTMRSPCRIAFMRRHHSTVMRR